MAMPFHLPTETVLMPRVDDAINPLPGQVAGQLDPTPQIFGEYELIEEIGRGGMGIVYKARQVKLNRLVALKMILPCARKDESARRRLQNEAEAAARLDHPGIVAVHDVGEQAGQPYICMAFVDGISLAARVACGALRAADAARIIADVAEAIDHVHERGVIHCDLSPSNILLDRAGRRRVTDFGLARILDTDQSPVAFGTIAGTPYYMSPEQAQGRTDRIGYASDIYSLGAILYHLLTGRPPFEGEGRIEILRRVCEDEPQPPRTIDATIPAELEAICLRCLQKDPAARYLSAKELARELCNSLAGQLPVVRTPRSTSRVEPATADRRSGLSTGAKPLAFIGSLAVIVAMAFATGATSYEEQTDRTLRPVTRILDERAATQGNVVAPDRKTANEEDGTTLVGRLKARPARKLQPSNKPHLGRLFSSVQRLFSGIPKDNRNKV